MANPDSSSAFPEPAYIQSLNLRAHLFPNYVHLRKRNREPQGSPAVPSRSAVSRMTILMGNYATLSPVLQEHDDKGDQPAITQTSIFLQIVIPLAKKRHESVHLK